MAHALDYVGRISRKAFLRTWGNPNQAHDARSVDNRNYRYERLWDLYDGTAFNNKDNWQQYQSAFGTYRQIRQIWDHCHEIVEFYAAHVWRGTLAKDGLHLPNGVDNAIPLAEDTDPALALAIAQLWQWWNFQIVMTTVVRYTAALGELLVEIVDDPDRGKISIELVWPGHVKDVHLDDAGNVTYYCIEYSYIDDDDGRTYRYKREVDKASFRTYRDDEPFDYNKKPMPDGADPTGDMYGLGSGSDYLVEDDDTGHEVPNPYGFVPARWFRHNRVMGVRGEPAIWSTQAQIDEINSLFSHMMDKAHIMLEAPIVVSGNISPTRLQSSLSRMFGDTKRGPTSDLDDPNSDKETLNILEGPAGTSVNTIQLNIREVGEAVDRVIKVIEKKCPEVTFYSELRGMTQITGAAASRLLGDVDGKVKMYSAGYDYDATALFQMGVAIAGWRLSSSDGRWSEKTKAQLKFKGFDLESYAKGDLDFDIMPRDLVPLTIKDTYDLLVVKHQVMPWLPPEQIAKEGGYSEADGKKWSDEYDQAQADKAQKQMEAMQQNSLAKQGVPPPGTKQDPTQKQAQNGNIKPFKKAVGAPPGGPQHGQAQQSHRSSS